MTSLFPDICSERVNASRDFYRDLFGFEVAFQNEWYVQLRLPGEPVVQLAFVERAHHSVPLPWQRPAQGVLVTLELDDVDACHARARELGLPIVYPLRDEVWGQRHFMVEDPNGLLVDVVKLIP